MVLSRQLRLHWLAGAAVVAALYFVAAASAAGPITINDPATCTTGPCLRANSGPDYPSLLAVSGSAPISTLEVKFIGFWHDIPDDVDVLLISPTGSKVVLMSDAGSSDAIPQATPINFSFKDGGDPLPNECPDLTCTDGTTLQHNKIYAPADYDVLPQTSNSCVFFVRGDAGDPADFAGAVATRALLGTTANGIWKLEISDDCGEGDPGGLPNTYGGGGLSAWCLVINGMNQGCPASAVTVAAFSATRAKMGARVTWRTVQEAGVAGFNLYRTQGKQSVKVNRTLVRAKRAGTAQGASYAVSDRTAKRGVAYTYKLQIVERTGKRSFAATVPLARR